MCDVSENNTNISPSFSLISSKHLGPDVVYFVLVDEDEAQAQRNGGSGSTQVQQHVSRLKL